MSSRSRRRVPERDVERRASRSADGETVALLGPNGAGQVDRALGGCRAAAPRRGPGRARRPGADDVGAGARVRRGAARTADRAARPGAAALPAPVRARQRRASARAAGGAAAARRRERGPEWLEQVGAADLADRRPASSPAVRPSGSRSPARSPPSPTLLLLDEPMAALDVAVTPALRQTLRAGAGRPDRVLVTHDVLDALLLADRVVVLDGGRVVEEGPSREVLARPRSAFAARHRRAQHGRRGTWRDGARAAPTAASRSQGLAGRRQRRSTADRWWRSSAPTRSSVFRERAGRQPAQRLRGHGHRPRAAAAT